MIEEGIFDRDFVIIEETGNDDVSNGDIVVALLGDEATVKRFYPRQDAVELRPANPNMVSTILDDVQIIGKVVGLVRSLR